MKTYKTRIGVNVRNSFFLTLLAVLSLSPSTCALADYIGHAEARIYISGFSHRLVDENSIRWGSAGFKTVSDLGAAWDAHFAGELTFPDPYQNTARLLKFKNSNCKNQITSLNKLLDSYALQAEKSQDGKLSSTRDDISDLLNEGRNIGCFDDLSRLLAARSLSLLAQDDRYDTCDGPISRCKLKRAELTSDAVHLLTNAPNDKSTIIANNWVLNLIAISLINHDHVVFMTPEQRARIGLKSNFLGAYDCGVSKIYLDPFMSPLDLAATFAHEIEHVMRDKFLDLSQTGLSAKQFLILDETLAASYAGFLQRNLSQFYQTSSTQKRALDLIADIAALHFGQMGKDSHNNYDLEGDLSFFSPTGPLNSLWTALGFQPLMAEKIFESGLSLVHSLSTWSDFEDMTLLRADSEKIPAIADKLQEFGLATIDAHVDEVYGIVKKVYFNEPMTNQDRESFNPAHLGLAMDPLAQVLRSTIIPFTQDLSQRESLDLISQLDMIQFEKVRTGFGSDTISQLFGGGSASYNNQKKALDIRFKIDGILEQLDLLEASFSGPSAVCIKIDEAAKRGELAGYAGIEGYVGTRPGAEGVRPGSEGVRPGVEGVRPGAEGVRPGLRIRTCVSLPRKL